MHCVPLQHFEMCHCASMVMCVIIRQQFVKLREREGQRLNLGRSLKGHLWMVDGGYPFPDALH